LIYLIKNESELDLINFFGNVLKQSIFMMHSGTPAKKLFEKSIIFIDWMNQIRCGFMIFIN
jgi:hypothetical protein